MNELNDVAAEPVAVVEQNGDVVPAEAVGPEQEEPAQPTPVSDEEVKQRLLVLLGKSDLNQTTEKMLRKQLEKELGQDLSSKKALIRQEVLDYLEQQQPAEEEEEEEEEEEKPKKRGGGFGGPCLLSEELQKFVGEETMSRSQVVKSIWDYIKANNLQNPKDKRQIIIDNKLSTLFKSPLTMFSMNKQLTKHIFKASDVKGGGDSDDEEGSAAPKAKPKPAKRARKAGSDDEDGGGKRKGTGFGKPLPLSDALAAACGKAEMNRGEICKWLYGYCDEHNLKDPSDKRFAICDATLQQLTGESRIQLFGGQKYFKEHILGK